MGLLQIFGKKKCRIDRLAQAFIESTILLFEEFEEDLVYTLKHHPEFYKTPPLTSIHFPSLFVVVLAGNNALFKNVFSHQEHQAFRHHLVQKSAQILQIKPADLEELLSRTTSLMKRLNHPSKNIQYGMSKGLFHYLKLNDFQTEYFKKLDTPNPIIHKALDLIIENFTWNWKDISNQYKLQ